MSRFGKCQNFSGCLLAYRGEETEVDSDQPFICAECGKPLTEVGSPSAMWMRYLYIVAGVVVVGGVLIFAVPSLRGKIFKPKKGAVSEVQPATPAPSDTTFTPPDNPPVTPSVVDSGTPPPTATPPESAEP